MEVIATAQRLADEVLFPAALATDMADIVPVDRLDALAEAGFYALSGPTRAGGLDADFNTVCTVVETLASGCLTTTFVWVQHLGAVIAASASENEAIRDWVSPLCSGQRRAGLALGGAIAGAALLRARQTENGWTFTGTSPYVSGWHRFDVIHTAARTDDGRLVWALIDAQETDTLTIKRLRLAALNATATVRAEFHDYVVPAQRVTSVVPHLDAPAPPELLRIHAALALGVAVRCCRLLGPTPLDEELARVRSELDRLDPTSIETARALASELAARAAAALVVTTGSPSLLVTDHAQRLAREALFGLVYALRPHSRDALLANLRATPRRPGVSPARVPEAPLGGHGRGRGLGSATQRAERGANRRA